MESDGIAAFAECRAPHRQQTHWLGYDPNSGIYYHGYRGYDPNLQRLINRDPLGEAGGINLDQFVDDNPIHEIDPFGADGITIGPSRRAGGVEGWRRCDPLAGKPVESQQG